MLPETCKHLDDLRALERDLREKARLWRRRGWRAQATFALREAKDVRQAIRGITKIDILKSATGSKYGVSSEWAWIQGRPNKEL